MLRAHRAAVCVGVEKLIPTPQASSPCTVVWLTLQLPVRFVNAALCNPKLLVPTAIRKARTSGTAVPVIAARSVQRP